MEQNISQWWSKLTHVEKCDLLDTHATAGISWHKINSDLIDWLREEVIIKIYNTVK